MAEGIEEFKLEGEIAAIVVRHTFHAEGIHFVTPDDYSQQVGYMSHPAGKVIDAHRHIPHERQVHLTNEVLLVTEGKLRVNLYDSGNVLAESTIVGPGDLVLLVSGAHGFEVLEPVRMIEVKQGPYVGHADKERFDPAHVEPDTSSSKS